MKTTIHLPFSGGVDEKTAAQYLDPAQRQSTVLNGNFSKTGVIDKRTGIGLKINTLVAGSTVSAITVGERVTGWSRSPLTVLGQGGLYTYSTAEQGLVGVGPLPSVKTVRRPITTSQSPSAPVLVDMPYGGTTLRISVFYDQYYDIMASVSDAVTGDVVLQATQIQGSNGFYSSPSSSGPFTVSAVVSAIYLPNAPAGKQILITIVGNASNVSNGIYAVGYDPSTNTFSGGGGVLLATASSPSFVDCVPMNGDPSGGFVLFYSDTTTSLSIKYFTPALVLTLTKPVTYGLGGGTTIVDSPCYAYCTYGAGNTEHCWFVYQSYRNVGSTYSWYVLETTGDLAFTTQNAPTALSIYTDLVSPSFTSSTTVIRFGGICRYLAHDLFFTTYALSNPGGANGVNTVTGVWYRLRDTTPGTPGGLSSVPTAIGLVPFSFYPAAKPFIAPDGYPYQAYNLLPYVQANVQTGATNTGQNTLYLCKFTNPMGPSNAAADSCYPVATVAPRQCSSAIDVFQRVQYNRLPFMSATVPGSTRFGIGIRTSGVDQAGISGAQGPAWSADFYFDAASLTGLYQTSELGSELSISGSVPFVADSNSAFEDGFFSYPEFTYAVLSGVGNTLPTGAYTYAVVYTYVDAAGLVHRGAPWITSPVTPPGGTTGPILHIVPLPTTWRNVANPQTVYAEIYRTTINGSTFYLVDRVRISQRFGVVDIVWPSTGNDNTTDAAIKTSTLLYTTGGVLDHVNPPSSSMQIVHRGRKALVDETLRSVWFSKIFEVGVAPGFNEVMVVPFPDGGDITALASMDDKFIVFKSTYVFVMYGDGPNQLGTGSDWTVPQRLASDVGAVSWQSVVLTPAGLMFQASNGIYLLSRSLQVSFIGKAVTDTLALYPVITSSTLVSGATQVRFTCNNGSTSISIIYDYLLDQWLTHSYARLSSQVASAAMSVGATPQYTLLTTDGNIWQERLPLDGNLYLDSDVNGSTWFVPTSITTAPVKFLTQGNNRFGRVQFYGEILEATGLKMDMAINSTTAVVQSSSWLYTDLAKLPIPGQVQSYVAGAYNRSMALQITVTDTGYTSPVRGRGMRFVGLAIEIENLGDRYQPVPAGSRR